MALPARPVLIGLAKTVLVFALIGPPIGTVVFIAGMALNIAGGTGLADTAVIFAFMLLYGLPFGYALGIGPAVACGLVVSGWRIWRGDLTPTMLGLIGLGVGFVMVALMGGHAPETRFTAASLILACLGATLICGWLSTSKARSA
jgi:hypothetical protein